LSIKKYCYKLAYIRYNTGLTSLNCPLPSLSHSTKTFCASASLHHCTADITHMTLMYTTNIGQKDLHTPATLTFPDVSSCPMTSSNDNTVMHQSPCDKELLSKKH